MGDLNLVEESKIRRLFRARNKISFPSAICHITQHAAGKERLFLEDRDYLYMLHLLKENARRFEFEVFCFTLLPNHLHLLFQLSKDNLSVAMKRLFEDYAKFANNKYGRRGHLFSGSFRQALCLNENYLLTITLYIHRNAVEAGLVNVPVDYRWSSCALYLQPIHKESFVNYRFILGILDKDLKKAQKIYRELLEKTGQVKMEQSYVSPRAIEFFRAKIMGFFPPLGKLSDKDRVGFLEEKSLEEIIQRLKAEGKLRRPESVEARKDLVEQLKARGYTMEVIAKMLGLSRQTIYRIINVTNSAMQKM